MLDAPRALVFKMWADPKHIVHWAIPKGFAPPVIGHMDFRTGGSLRMLMRFSDSNEYLSKWSYIEIVEHAKIVYDAVCDENGKTFHKARQSVEFTEHQGRTMLSIRGRIELLAGRDPRWTPEIMMAGWAVEGTDNFGNIERYLPTVRAR